MNATVLVRFEMTIEVEGKDLKECRAEAAAQIDDLTPEHIEGILDSAEIISTERQK